jgi:hypothetical protein
MARRNNDKYTPPKPPGSETLQIPGFREIVLPKKGEPQKAGPSMESLRRTERAAQLKQEMARTSNTVANNIKDSQNRVDSARAAREAAEAKARIERAGRTNKDGTVRPPGTATNADLLKSQQAASASKKKGALAAKMKGGANTVKNVVGGVKANMSKGKGGSSGAAGSWLQWSGAKRGNN